MLRKILPNLIIAAFLTGITALARVAIAKENLHYRADSGDEVLYLPSGKALHLVSFGYSNALSQLLWFQTISYFGKHYRQDQNYEWLYHYCSLVTNLNPKVEEVYLFCAQMLAWEAGKVDYSNSLLTKAIENHPENWYFFYLRGLNYSLFMKDYTKARDDFIAGARLPGAPPMMARIAAKTIQQLGSPETAIEFLEDALARSKDPTAKAALSSKLYRIKKALNQ